jgi:hypothetical protein
MGAPCNVEDLFDAPSYERATILSLSPKVTGSVSHIRSLKHELSASNVDVRFVPHSKHTASTVNLRNQNLF